MTRALALLSLSALLVSCGESLQTSPATDAHARVVTMAPNLTELVYAVGAGDSLVGVSAWSDFPSEASQLPVVGDAFTLDQEQLALLEPDLLLVWESGTPAHTIEELRKRGFNVAVVRTRALADIADAMLQIGELTNHRQAAADAARRFRNEIQRLRQTHSDAEPISVYFQVSARPLYTVNSEHYVSELIEICGGQNIFSDLNELAPTITVEAVVERNPEVMLASSDAGEAGFAEWQRWPQIAANLYGNLFVLPADELARATPRLISAGGAMCLALQKARFNRAVFQGTGPIDDAIAADGPKALPDRSQVATKPAQ